MAIGVCIIRNNWMILDITLASNSCSLTCSMACTMGTKWLSSLNWSFRASCFLNVASINLCRNNLYLPNSFSDSWAPALIIITSSRSWSSLRISTSSWSTPFSNSLSATKSNNKNNSNDSISPDSSKSLKSKSLPINKRLFSSLKSWALLWILCLPTIYTIAPITTMEDTNPRPIVSVIRKSTFPTQEAPIILIGSILTISKFARKSTYISGNWNCPPSDDPILCWTCMNDIIILKASMPSLKACWYFLPSFSNLSLFFAANTPSNPRTISIIDPRIAVSPAVHWTQYGPCLL